MPGGIEDRAATLLPVLLAEAKGIGRFAAAAMVDGRIVLEHNARLPLMACSTFKLAAATAVMSLVQRGTIALDRAIAAYDASLAFSVPTAAEAITLRMLLSHTSGLDDTDEPEPDPRACLPALRFVAEPGRAFRYSNVGFDLAVRIAAQCIGMDHRAFLRAQVLDALGMYDTAWADGFAFDAPVTTVRDLMRLAAEHMAEHLGGHSGKGRILRGAARADMQRIHADSYTPGACRWYGLGLGIEGWAERTLLAHGGGLAQYGTAFVIDPSAMGGAGAAVALLFDDPAGYRISPHGLLDRLLERTTSPPPLLPNRTDWTPWLGCYDNGAELLVEENNLCVHWKGARHPLSAVDDRLFTSPAGVSVGLLPGAPTMISVNDWILIGATPGRLLRTPPQAFPADGDRAYPGL